MIFVNKPTEVEEGQYYGDFVKIESCIFYVMQNLTYLYINVMYNR